MIAPSTDKTLADAYRELESPIADLRNMATLMRMLAENTIFQAESETVDEIKRRSPSLKSFRIIVLSDEDGEALGFGLHELTKLSKHLYKNYHSNYNNSGVG